jgi:hypothetical protein
MTAAAAIAPTSAATPRAECGSVCPPARGLSPGRGPARVAAAWQLSGTASYSAIVATTGPARPFRAAKAVGIPPLPGSTSHPRAESRSTYQAAERYSRQAVSPKSQIVRFQDDHSARCASIHS